MFGFKIISQYERGVVFRWGRATRHPGAGADLGQPGHRPAYRGQHAVTVAAVPGQETITRDNVTMRADAVVYYRVVDPFKAIVNVQDYRFAVAQVAQTSLRAVTGRSDMDRLLAEREQVNVELKDHRRAHRATAGHPRGADRDQGRLPARGDETPDVAAGRGRT
jgi:regulator of protease activity HflC (stomatin/prohibitin superfamily)